MRYRHWRLRCWTFRCWKKKVTLRIHCLAKGKLFGKPSLNTFMSMGREAWKQVRTILQMALSDENPMLRDDEDLKKISLIPMKDVEMCMPAEIGDYTDFYSSREHATNVGIMFRGKENALMPNWLHIPIAYHGRASSIVVSGTILSDQKGRQNLQMPEIPVFGARQNFLILSLKWDFSSVPEITWENLLP